MDEANRLGAAGEHLVCAELFLAGHRATMAAAGLPYDILADVTGRLVRVAVKSTAGPRERNGRPGSKPRYVFGVRRVRKRSSGTYVSRAYEAADVDVVALVALDIRRVAFIRLADCPQTIWLEADTPTPEGRPGPRSVLFRGFSDFGMESALTW